MKIAIVGNRLGWTYEEVRQFLLDQNVYKSDVIISGGADGVDTFAQQYAKEIGAKIIIIYPDMSKSSPKRYYDRNDLIVYECDSVIAFQKKAVRSGTQYTINKAKKENKPVLIFDGKMIIDE